ncbi:hypothetical protein ONE63_009016 [Megalurothrips usitatus]|uniref:C2H2-type domain-containing protein n=1 Tax=Megalurothrips usitatus TaxID=439358 RepID=A0AAV7XL03_9NEOP|nr:hypothetical protein ONE63_009016 [Megalurothrips usitatus]
MTVPCSECDSQFDDIYSFSVHFKVAHQNCSKYFCKVDQCTRSYNVYASFRRHLILSHHVPVLASQPTPLISQVVASNNDNCESNFVSSYLDVASQSDCYTSDASGDKPSVKDLLRQQEDHFIAKLYENPSFPHLPLNVKKQIGGMFNVLRNPFQHLQTEYKRFKYFESCGAYIPPISYEIDSREERVKTKGGVTLCMKSVLGQFIPLQSDVISNLMQCEVWKRKVAHFNECDIVMPVNVYFDEVEPNSALGSHCEPLGCSYVQIAALPPEWISRLENIFLALLFDGNNRSIYSNKKTFRPLIDELLYLETEGISLTITGLSTYKIYFVVAFVLGDNKGLNGVCGFVEGFSAYHYCRICNVHRDQAKQMFVEDPALLRTPENYAAAVELQDPQETGVKEECIFNRLPSFETPTDICVDQFHDLTEGVAHYTMLSVLKHFHGLNSMFINTLNNRMYCLDLGVDSDNRPPLINLDRLVNKDKLKMTGAEMHTFIRLFGVLVHDMIPEGDLFYELYLLLNDITSILYAKVLPKDMDKILQVKVKDHHMLYVNLTGEDLKPKHHFLVHYARLFQMMGPFNLIGTVRFEAKHREISQTAGACISRVNLSKTVAIKQQLGFCFRSVSNASLRQNMDYGPCHLLNLKELDTYPSFSLTLPGRIFDEPMQSVVTWVTYKGTTYKPKQVLLCSIDDFGLFSFAEIELIIKDDKKPLFICSSLDTIGYFSDVRGYEVKRMTEVNNWFAIDHDNLLDYNPLCLYQMSSSELVTVLKYTL